MSLGSKKLLEQFKTKIQNYFESFNSDKNIFIANYLEDIIIQPGKKEEYTISLPVGAGKKADFAMECTKLIIPTLAILKFKDTFPIKEVMVRIEFPNILFGVNGIYPKIIFTTEFKTAWPGDFGIVWEAITGQTTFSFFPYEDRENKVENIIKFYQEDILDPLCDLLNSSNNVVARKAREGIHKFLKMSERAANKIKTLEDYPKDHPWFYSNPFSKKRKNIIDIPIYSDYYYEQNKSLLCFEAYGLSKTWIAPSVVIFDILQYIVLAAEMFDLDGNLKSETELKKIEEILKQQELDTSGLERKKRAAEAKDKWDPFKTKKEVERDGLGFAVRQNDGIVLKKDTHAEEQAEKMKEMLHKTPSIPRITEPTISKDLTKETAFPSAPTQPQVTGPEQQKQTSIQAPEFERIGHAPKYQETLKQVETMKQMLSDTIPSKPALEVPESEVTSSTVGSTGSNNVDMSQHWAGLKEKLKKSAQLNMKSSESKPIPKATTPPTSIYSDPKQWFAELQMSKFDLAGEASGLPFREKGDFKILQTLTAPFMLSFARDTLRTKKMITSEEAIKILFKFFNDGYLKQV